MKEPAVAGVTIVLEAGVNSNTYHLVFNLVAVGIVFLQGSSFRMASPEFFARMLKSVQSLESDCVCQ